MNTDNKNEIIKNEIRYSLFRKFDLTHFSLGAIAIAIKKGTKTGIINLL